MPGSVSSSCENRTCRISPRRHSSVAAFFYEHEPLRIGQAGGNHHLSARFELMEQGRRNEVRSRRHDHLVEWSVLRPAMVAIGNLELNVGAALPAQPLLCL